MNPPVTMKETHQRRLLANRYQLIDMVGSGAMGQVYRAEDKLLGGVTVAVKFLSQALLNSKMRDRFEREATVSALLGEKSNHIVRVRDYGVDEKEIPFYVMEFLKGESLSDVIKFRPLNLERFLKIVRQICFGLECAHKGIMFEGEMCPIIHRDIKPSNVLVVQDPALGELVKILDFGIAKLIQSGEAQTQSFMGTLAYCSPEQIEGKELDSRSDIYSLGVMMYEMLTGEMPIFPENSSFGGWYEAHHYAKPKPIPAKFRLPSDLESLIFQCMAKAPGERPQTATDILKKLEKLESSPAESEQETLVAKPKPRTDKAIKSTKPTFRKTSPKGDDICLKMTWPEDKPQQKIVFPHVVRASEGNFASLWVMLNEEDIANRLSSIRYNQFVFITNPHPMILWITLLYHREHGPRWLPCYLDLKSSSGQRFARLLGESGYYWILFFALEKGKKCQHVLTTSIAADQCQNLQQWADKSQLLPGGKPQITKRMLKKEFEKLKPTIENKLKASYTTSRNGSSL
ncbi:MULTISPECIES: serine/threonine protein kinase [Crocosphaera]|uniref:Serine/threonine protein kinase n=4 Tax=Crocosphaera TaxID=263510 RepID=G5J2U5_CROWT|nr:MULTISPECIES: serine/threonine-protein kinase [Crocosphaera]EHJ13486.1 serine/threonine protein kinase [Crocosphaera watsonii WH 0003]MCH2244977.1 serine/threonine protein kinase [Crocosphaera sp.]CCQ56921.1 serine/threonine protein kinase [Crocosphaera watsonii WH 0005]